MILADDLNILGRMWSTPQLLLDFNDIMAANTPARSVGYIKIESVTLFGK